MLRALPFLAVLLALAPAAARPAAMYLSGETVMVEDLITAGDENQLEAKLRAKGRGAHVHLDSRGGDIATSLRMGRLLREYQARVTHGWCASACVLAFLGGTWRYYTDDPYSALRVHQPLEAEAFLQSTKPADKAALRELEEYCASMSGGDAFYRRMIAIPFSDPQNLTRDEARRLGVINAQ